MYLLFFCMPKILTIQKNGIIIYKNGEESHVKNDSNLNVIITQVDRDRWPETPQWIVMLMPSQKFRCQMYENTMWYIQKLTDRGRLFRITQDE